MKKLLFVLMSLTMIACGSESDTEATESKPYHIDLGGKGDEEKDANKLGFYSDNISQETEFTIGGTKLKVFGMAKEFKAEPTSIKGNSYEGEVSLGEDVHSCKVTISNVSERKSDDMKIDYDIDGKLEAKEGEGSFKVSMFKMN